MSNSANSVPVSTLSVETVQTVKIGSFEFIFLEGGQEVEQAVATAVSAHKMMTDEQRARFRTETETHPKRCMRLRVAGALGSVLVRVRYNERAEPTFPGLVANVSVERYGSASVAAGEVGRWTRG